MNQLNKGHYVWKLPVRLYHWINAYVVSILFITGLYIASPLFSSPTGEASWYKGMAWFRYIHFSTAFVFIANFLFRLYWALNGNDQYGKFGGFKPWLIKWWGQPFKDQMASYMFIKKEEPNYSGHNPVAALSYFLFVFCGSFFMIITGLAMYGENNPDGFTDTLFGWIMPLIGSTELLHTFHHLVAWIFPVFFILHFYAILRHDFVEHTSVMSSMVNGYKRNVKDSTDLTN